MHVEIFSPHRGSYYLRLVAGNGEIINVSESYATKWNAKRAARRVFPSLEILYVTSEGKIT